MFVPHRRNASPLQRIRVNAAVHHLSGTRHHGVSARARRVMESIKSPRPLVFVDPSACFLDHHLATCTGRLAGSSNVD